MGTNRSSLCSARERPSCTQKAGTPGKPSSSPSPSCTALGGWIFPLWFSEGCGKVKGGVSYKLFLPQSNFKKQQSQKRMRRSKHHTFFGTQTPRQRQTGRQTLTHTQALRPLAATHHLVSLLVSHPLRAGWGCGSKQVTCNHTLDPFPTLKPSKTQRRG